MGTQHRARVVSMISANAIRCRNMSVGVRIAKPSGNFLDRLCVYPYKRVSECRIAPLGDNSQLENQPSKD